MPHYEIIVHLTRELPCLSAEDAAAVIRRQVLAERSAADALLHLAVWREDAPSATSPLPPSLRQTLVDVFTALERSAAEAEITFRERVAAILIAAIPDGP